MGHRDHSGHVRLWVRFVQATGLAVIALATTSAPAVSARELFLQRPVATAASVQDGTSVFAGFTSALAVVLPHLEEQQATRHRERRSRHEVRVG
jgi:hypothetical protein